MTARIELPYCVDCGAAPSSRQQPACSYCGAVLPWEIWDEASKRAVEVTRVEGERLRELITSGRNRRRMRVRRRVHRPEKETTEVEPWVAPTLLIAVIGATALPTLIEAAPILTFVGAIVLVGIIVLAVRWREDAEEAKKLGRRRAWRRRGRRSMDAAILTVSPPSQVPGAETVWRRLVTAYSKTGKQHVFTAPAELSVEPGQVGRLRILGTAIVAFEPFANVE